MKYLITSLILSFLCCRNNINSYRNEQKKEITKSKNGICKRHDKLIKKTDQKIFCGDSIIGLGYEKYFKLILENNSYLVLKKQNDLYGKKFSNFKSSGVIKSKFKFVKQIINDKKDYRIILYTFINNKKKDSIEFYRNVNDLKYEPSNYACLSYLDIKNAKVWQIRYFSSTVDKSVDYILYKNSEVKKNGKIETDSLYYLDESLDVEMEKNNLK